MGPETAPGIIVANGEGLLILSVVMVFRRARSNSTDLRRIVPPPPPLVDDELEDRGPIEEAIDD